MPMNKKILLLISMIVCLAVFMLLTNPNEIPLGFLLVPFLIISIIVFLAANYLINLLRNDKKTKKKTIVFSAALSVIIMNFLVLRSVGQLTLQDGLISVLITIILGFYIGKLQIGR